MAELQENAQGAGFVAGDQSKTIHERIDAIENWILDREGKTKEEATVEVPTSATPGVPDQNEPTPSAGLTVVPNAESTTTTNTESVKL